MMKATLIFTAAFLSSGIAMASLGGKSATRVNYADQNAIKRPSRADCPKLQSGLLGDSTAAPSNATARPAKTTGGLDNG